jgi:hypothetical protein
LKRKPARATKGDRNRGVRPTALATTHPWWPHVWKMALLWSLVFAAYSNSFNAGFVYDNESAILEDARVHEANLSNAHRILTEGYWVNQPTADLYRPVTTLSYLLNYAILGNGTNPAGYHWVNLVLHAANVSLVYALGISIFGDPALGLALAAIWGLHPLLTESVTNIVGRADLLAAWGILMGLLCHIRATAADEWRKAGWLIALTLSSPRGAITRIRSEDGQILSSCTILFRIVTSLAAVSQHLIQEPRAGDFSASLHARYPLRQGLSGCVKTASNFRPSVGSSRFLLYDKRSFGLFPKVSFTPRSLNLGFREAKYAVETRGFISDLRCSGVCSR